MICQPKAIESLHNVYKFKRNFITLPFSVKTIEAIVLSFVDGEEAVADGGKVRTQRWKLVPAVTHQLNQLNVVGRVVGWDWRTKRRRLTSTHAHEYICLP